MQLKSKRVLVNLVQDIDMTVYVLRKMNCWKNYLNRHVGEQKVKI